MLLEFGLIVVAARVVFAKLPDRVPPFRLGAGALALTGIGMATVALVPSVVGLFVGAGIMAGGVAFTTPAFFSAVMLPARVEIALAAGDVSAAQEAATELATIAERYPTVALRAVAAGAQGAVGVARSDRGSLAKLRDSWRLWQETPAPFEAARVGVLLARARQAAGDHDGALLEIDASVAAFERLGAWLDVVRARALASELRTIA